MKTASYTILFFLALVSATPLAKRALVVETVVEEVTMTVDTTTTVWVAPTSSTVAPQQNYQQPASKHGYSHQHLHTHAPAAPAYNAPAPQAPKAAPAASIVQAPKAAAPAPVVPAPQPATPAPVVQAPQPAAPAPVVQAPKAAVPVPVPAYTPPTVSPPVSPPVPVAPASTPASQGSSYGSGSSGGACGTVGGKCSGDITYYQAGLGACGWTNDGSTEDVFALAHGMMGEQSNGNPFCGRMATIKVPGKPAVTAKLVDKCMGCEGQSIDLSNHLFDQLCDESTGRVHNVEWSFNS